LLPSASLCCCRALYWKLKLAQPLSQLALTPDGVRSILAVQCGHRLLELHHLIADQIQLETIEKPSTLRSELCWLLQKTGSVRVRVDFSERFLAPNGFATNLWAFSFTQIP